MRRKNPHPFGDVILRLRKERNLSGYALAKKLGKSPDQIRSVERGDNSPKIETIEKYAEALEMEPWDLFKELILAMRKAREVEADESSQKC